MKYIFLLFVALFSSVASAQILSPSSKQDSALSKVECMDLSEDPKLLNEVKIKYPTKAKGARSQGKVTFAVLIDTNGKVIKAVIEKSENEIFNQPVIEAAKKLRFTPAKLDSECVKVWDVLSVRFDFKKRFAELTNRDPKVIGALKVKYPSQAKKAHLEGLVTFSAHIGEDGKVEKVVIDKATDDIFKQPTIEAVMKTRFEPATRDSKPVKVWYSQTIAFKLNKNESETIPR